MLLRLVAVTFAYAVFCSTPSNSQYYFYNDKYLDSDLLFEVGVSVGAMNCLTDLGGRKGTGKKFTGDLNFRNTKASYGFHSAFMYRQAFGLRLEYTFGNLTAYDSILKNVASSTFGRYERGLSFRTSIIEVLLCFELHPLHFIKYARHTPSVSPYAIGGIGFFSFNPETLLNGNWYLLQPLCTEGQGFPEFPERTVYKLRQLNFPVGAGIKYEASPLLNLRLELIYRILRTDYLDDVSTSYIEPTLFYRYLPANQAAVASKLADRQSDKIPNHTTLPGQQRGNPGNNDAYFSLQIRLGLVIGRFQR